jgi:hypothetical protein
MHGSDVKVMADGLCRLGQQGENIMKMRPYGVLLKGTVVSWAGRIGHLTLDISIGPGRQRYTAALCNGRGKARKSWSRCFDDLTAWAARNWLYDRIQELASREPGASPLVSASLEGDGLARLALADWIEDRRPDFLMKLQEELDEAEASWPALWHCLDRSEDWRSHAEETESNPY